MQKLKLICCAYLLFSFGCVKAIDPISDPTGDGTQTPTPNPTGPGGGGGSTIISGCDYIDVPYPTSYTYTDLSNVEAGYGIFGTGFYDKGYKAGYQDGRFYLTYYNIVGANVCGSFSTVQGIQKTNSPNSSILYKPLTYRPAADETSLGIFLKYSGSCTMNWQLITCVLQNAIESKSLRLQYEFNMNYTGPRTQDQIDYDAGRYNGFIRATTTQPVN